MTMYSYTKSPVSVDGLTSEIEAAAFVSAVYEYIVFNSPDTLQISFIGDLSPTEKTTLDGIVIAHPGIETYDPAGYIATATGSGSLILTPAIPVDNVTDAASEEYVDNEINNIENYIDATVSGSFASVLTRKTTTLALPTSYIDVSWEATDIEIDDTIIKHDDINTDNIMVYQDGLYLISYSLSIDADSTEATFDIRLRKNDTTVIPGSLRTISEDDEINDVSNVFTVVLDAGDFITLQAQSSATGDILHTSSNLMITKLGASKGLKGDTGDQGPQGQDGVLTVSGTADYFNGYDSAGTTQLNTTYTDIPLTQGYMTSAFSHSGAEVTVDADNTYVIVGRFTVAQPTTTDRSEAQMRLVIDTGGGYTEIPGTIGVCYSRTNVQGKSSASAQAVLDLNVGDKIKLQAQENSGGTLFGDQNGSGLMIFTTAGQVGPQGLQGPAGINGTDGADGADGQDGIDAGGTLSVVQARRTTAYTLTTTYTNITFDTTDEETDAAVVEHNNTNTDRIDIKDDGTFLITYDFNIDASNSAADVTYTEGRVLLNNTTAVDGSWSRTTTFNDTSLDGNDLFHNHLSGSCIETLTSGDFVTLQLKYSNDGADTAVNGTIKVINLVGAKGDDGADGAPGTPGSGSTVNIYDEGSSVTNTPHSTLNFEGTAVTATDAGGGQVDITIDAPGLTVQDEGSNLTSTPHSTMNFTGAGVSAANVAGVATVTIGSPTATFGSEYQFVSAETETNTNSVSQVTKLTLSTASIPAGDYRVNWYYEWRRNTASNDYRADVEVDGTLVMEHREESKDVNTWHTNAGFDNVTLTTGTHTIVLYHYGDSTGSTSYTRRARLEIWRVS